MPKNVVYSLLAAVVIVLCLLALTISFIFPRISTLDPVDQNVVLQALSQTPLARAKRVQWFSGGTVEQTISGQDALGRKLYVIAVKGNPLQTVYANRILTASQAKADLQSLKKSTLPVTASTLGFMEVAPASVAPQSTMPLVWELTVHKSAGQFSYYFISAYNGKLLWNFSSSVTFRLWAQ